MESIILGRDTQVASTTVLVLNQGGRYMGGFHFITHCIFSSLCVIPFSITKADTFGPENSVTR